MNKILFICSANKDRSRTAEDFFQQKFPSKEFKSMGTNQKICFQQNTNFITNEDLVWADSIFIMEKIHQDFIQKTFGSNFNNKIEVLKIKDHFVYNQKELIEILENKLSKYF